MMNKTKTKHETEAAGETKEPAEIPPRDSSQSTLFYGWVVVAACFGVTLTLGETFWSFGVFFKPLQQAFGWSRAEVSSIFSAFILGYAMSVIVSGRLSDRYNPKPLLFVSAALVGCGLCLCALGTTLHLFRFFMWIVGLGSGATYTVPNSIVQRWFYGRKKGGLALGIVVSGVGVGAVIFAPLINFLLLSYGLRSTFLIVGVLFSVIVSGATLVIRQSPTEGGPVSREGLSEAVSARGGSATRTSQLLMTWAFVSVAFLVSVGTFTFQTLSVHLVAYATDAGVSSTASAAALGLMGGFSIPGRIMGGFFADRLGWHRLLSLSFFGLGVSTLLLFDLKGHWMLYGFVLSFGVSHGIRMACQVGVLPEIFGMRSLGELIGISSAIGQSISFLGPYVAGLIFDLTGSYRPLFLVLFLAMSAGGVVAAMLRRIAAGRVPVVT